MRLNSKYAMMAVAALTLGLTSCSNDDDVTKGANGEKAKLSINVTAPTTSRASVTNPATVPNDAAVNNFTAFVVDGGSLSSGYSNDGTDLTGANAIPASTTSSAVYVIANAGDLTSSITTVADLTSYIADLNGMGNQTNASGRWATGQTGLVPGDFTQNAAGDFVATKSVTLTFIAARITVIVDNQMTNYTASGALTLDNIAVLNARGESLLFPASGASLIPSTYATGNARNFYEGLADNSFSYYPASGDFTMATSLLSEALPATPVDLLKETYYYYVFENDAITAAAFPTIVTLIGDDNGTPVYWPVHLAPYESWAASSGSITAAGITRGNSYDIHITLKGDALTGGNGTDDPTNPVVSAFVQVSVTLTPWNPITLNKEF